jgi:hypothetical protein
VGHHRRQVGLGTGREKEPRLHPEALGANVLQSVDGGVVPEHVVTDDGVRHGAAHARAGLRNGVASEVNFVQQDSSSFSRGWNADLGKSK